MPFHESHAWICSNVTKVCSRMTIENGDGEPASEIELSRFEERRSTQGICSFGSQGA